MIHGHQGRSYKFTEEESIAIAGVMEEFLEKRRQDRHDN